MPRWISDGAVIVESDGGRLSVVGWHSQSFGLINEHIWHPEPGGFVGIKSEVMAHRVFTVNILWLGNYSAVLKLFQINYQRLAEFWQTSFAVCFVFANCFLVLPSSIYLKVQTKIDHVFGMTWTFWIIHTKIKRLLQIFTDRLTEWF